MRAIRYGEEVGHGNADDRTGFNPLCVQLDMVSKIDTAAVITDEKFQSAVRAIRYGVKINNYHGKSFWFQSAVRAIRYGEQMPATFQTIPKKFQSAVRAIRYGVELLLL